MLLKWRSAWILALALLAGPAFALGLGQIQVRSQYGEPLLAEIQIVSSDPAELRQLQARLASAETFARIGLQPPQGLVQNLQFNVALDATGRPVIRVTSTEPVEQPLLTFLIEADWGQGRLVREYSALVDAPDTIAAPAQPPIQAPEVDAGDRIIRPAPAPVAQEPASPPPGPEAAEPAEQPDAQPVADAPGEDAAEPAAPAAPPASRQAPAVPGEYGPVQAGDTLSAIAQGMAREQGVSVNQMMIALLRTNPGAFISGNINLLREGAVLRIPDGAEAGQLTAAEATAEVRSHVARWREMSAPRPQPQDTAALAATAVEEEPSAAAEAAESPGSALADARLEIAPASADGERQAGTRSGITAGGEGEMLRQELQETRESLAARDAEVEELRSRLAELEQLQQQQQRLIELKDSELAAVQQRLAESNQQEAPTLAQANQDPAGGQVHQDAGMPWLWIGLVLVLVLVIAAALAWARTRRDRAVVPAARGAAPAAAGASAAASAQRSPTWHAGGGQERVEPQVTPQDRQAPQPANEAAADEPAAAPIAAEGPRPAAPAFPPEPAETPRSSSVEDQPSAATVPPVELDAVPEEQPAAVGDLLSDAGERLELAKAYAELGDVDTARALLEEVARERDTPESSEAARLLSELA